MRKWRVLGLALAVLLLFGIVPIAPAIADCVTDTSTASSNFGDKHHLTAGNAGPTAIADTDFGKLGLATSRARDAITTGVPSWPIAARDHFITTTSTSRYAISNANLDMAATSGVHAYRHRPLRQ